MISYVVVYWGYPRFTGFGSRLGVEALLVHFSHATAFWQMRVLDSLGRREKEAFKKQNPEP